MKNAVKQKFAEGRKILGTFFESGSEITAECIGYSGLDYMIIDSEHGPFDVESALRYIRAAKFAGTTPFVRVKDSCRNSILKMLDAGAMGLIIPNLQTVEEAHRIVEYGKYFPLGDRGIAPTVGMNYWTKDYATQGMDHYIEVTNAETLLIPICETRGCLENLETIVNIEGIDGIFVGPFDLSAALGTPGDFSNPEVIEAIQHVADVCRSAGKMSLIYGVKPEDIKRRFEQGYDSVAYSMDSLILIDALSKLVKQYVG